MANWLSPALTDTFTNLIAFFKNRDEDIARAFDPATTAPTNVPTNAIGFSSANRRWEKWNGSSWVENQSAYNISADRLGGVAAALYAQLNSPALTGTPSAPTVSDSRNNSTLLATTAYVQAVRAALETAIVGAGTNTYTAAYTPALGAYVTHLLHWVRLPNGNSVTNPTLNINGLGARTIKRAGGAALEVNDIKSNMYGLFFNDGTDFILLNPDKPADVFDLGSTSAGDAYTASPSPVIGSLDVGAVFLVKFINGNTSTTPSLNVSGLGAKTLKKGSGIPLAIGDIPANHQAVLRYDGTDLFLINPAKGIVRGKQSIWIPAGAMTPQETSGPGQTQIQFGSNATMYKSLDFDASTNESAEFGVMMPKSWDLGQVTYRVTWYAVGGSGGQAVNWVMQANSYGDQETLDVAFGATADSVDTLNAANQIHYSPDSNGLTVNGGPSAREYVQFRVWRNAAAGGDTLAADARMLGVEITFNSDKADDS